MPSGARDLLLRALRVPPEPRVPDADAGRVRVFRAAPNFFRYNLLRWGAAQLGALVGLLVGFVVLRVAPQWLPAVPLRILHWVEALAWVGFLVQLPITFAMLRLDYELRWYIVTDRSLRIREGLNRVREQTMTFANVQNMAIRQGPLQRLLGIADVEVQTAGGATPVKQGKGESGGGQSMHVGLFRGVDNAAEIRDTIRERVRRHRDAGLGDPDDATADPGELAAPLPREQPGMLRAAGELLDEVRGLRAAVASGRGRRGG